MQEPIKPRHVFIGVCVVLDQARRGAEDQGRRCAEQTIRKRRRDKIIVRYAKARPSSKAWWWLSNRQRPKEYFGYFDKVNKRLRDESCPAAALSIFPARRFRRRQEGRAEKIEKLDKEL